MRVICVDGVTKGWGKSGKQYISGVYSGTLGTAHVALMAQ